MPMTQRGLIAVITFALLMIVAPVVAAQATQEQPASKPLMVQGELIRVDADAKTLAIKAADGNQLEFRYTDATEVSGGQEGVAGLATMSGAQVIVHFTTEKGANIATRIEVQEKK